MCCTNDKKPVFKGIQVPPAASAAVGASSASAVAIAIMAAVLLLGLASPAAAFGVEKATGDGLSSYCVFLDGSQELDCVCPDNGAGGDGDFSSLFSAQGMISSYVTSSKSSSPSRKKSSNVAAVHLHSCGHLRLLDADLTSVPRPFHRLRLEDLSSASIEGGISGLRPGDAIDVWVRNVNGSVVVEGELRCPQCVPPPLTNGSVSNVDDDHQHPQAEVTFHFLNVRNVTFSSFRAGAEVRARIQVRNADRVYISDSLLALADRRGAMEVANAPYVKVERSEFLRSVQGSVSLSRVAEMEVRGSILDREAIDVDTSGGGNGTEVRFSCSRAPGEVIPGGEVGCAGIGIGAPSPQASGGGGAESAGAIVLAVVSSLLLLAVVGVLFMLHRTGKLDEYL